ncbi:MAG: PEGA domain-containing protein [Methanoregula sp.]|jgi:hypothetical protein
MSYTNKIFLCYLILACCSFFTIIPAHAFTANSLDITVDENGDAIATFSFTLQGFVENAIPQSVLEEKLIGGLATSSDPPVLKSMDKSNAVLQMKKFAEITEVPTGTNYLTATMDFKKAEIALENSGLSSVVSADFSPEKITLTFPDSYKKEYSNVDVLPAVSHIIEDPVKIARLQAEAEARALAEAQAQASYGATVTPTIITTTSGKGSVYVTSTPSNVNVFLDSVYLGEAPALFPDIAAGSHSMEFSKDGFSPVKKDVVVISEKTTNVIVALSYGESATTEDTSSFPWVPVLVVIIGLMVIAIGGYYYWSEKKKNEWGKGKNPKTGETEDRVLARKDVVVKDIIIREPEAGKTAVTTATARIPDAVNPVVIDTPYQAPEASNTVINDTAARDPDVGQTATSDTPTPDPEGSNTTVSETAAHEPKVRKKAVRDTTGRKPKVSNTVVRVTLLKDIPDKEPGDNETPDKPE